jgi:hypothetical protein
MQGPNALKVLPPPGKSSGPPESSGFGLCDLFSFTDQQPGRVRDKSTLLLAYAPIYSVAC